MAERNIYLKIEAIHNYSPVQPADHVSPPIVYARDCMRNPGHEDGHIPPDEVHARRLNALIYREYLDLHYLVPKPDKLVLADINEPPFTSRVPGTVIYTMPGERLRIHIKNADLVPHSFHVHGLKYGIDSDGSWPFGTQASDGRRSDEICPGQHWTYTFDVTEEMIGAWPFHDHHRDIGISVNRGLFGGIIVLSREECEQLPRFPLPPGLEELLQRGVPPPKTPHPQPHVPASQAQVLPSMPAPGLSGISRFITPGMRALPLAHPFGMAMPGPPRLGTPPVPMPGHQPPRHEHGVDPAEIPEELMPYLALLEELAHAPGIHRIPKPPHTLHVPLFFHLMNGGRTSPVFQSAPLTPGTAYTSPPFTFATVYNYFCGVHGPSMAGSITVQANAPTSVNVTVVDNQFIPPTVTVGTGGTVTWTNNGPSLHSVVEQGGDSLPSFCFNGRTFIGNSPTIVAETGQTIRWYVFNLDLGINWHNFHPHAQRWKFAHEAIDIRSLGPAESFVVETVAPPVLLLPPDIEQCQHPDHRPPDAQPYRLRGDFLFHCHVEMHMMQGLAGLVRSLQTVWLTAEQAAALAAESGLALDPGGNDCVAVDLERCANAMGGRWEELPNLPEITFMHAVLLNTTPTRVLFWGYGPRADQARLWDQSTGLYSQPANQPQALAADENIWSGAHAFLNDAAGTVLLHGGFRFDPNPPLTADTERRAFLFDPASRLFTAATPTNTGRFYPTTLTLADGRLLTLFGQDNAGGGATAASLEIFTPGGAGAWSAPQPLPFNYFYYPWTFLLPDGRLFVAGPQKPARRFDWTATPVVDAPANQFNQVYAARGVNMDGTAVLLPLKPPGYAPRVLIAGGNGADTQQSAEWIDLSVPNPAWEALPDMVVPRDKVNSVLLPDGRVLIVGGIETLSDGGPAELFDPEDPASGFLQGPSMKYKRGYHSAALLLPDGSVVVGGDPNGPTTPHERYLPPYFFQTRPTITTAPAAVAYGASFAVTTPQAATIAEVVLMRPGAVTHGFNQSQRSVGCAISSTAGTVVQATAPPDGNLAPPGYYLLFVVDNDRVPSTGVWIQLG
jgi:plastocyanin